MMWEMPRCFIIRDNITNMVIHHIDDLIVHDIGLPSSTKHICVVDLKLEVAAHMTSFKRTPRPLGNSLGSSFMIQELEYSTLVAEHDVEQSFRADVELSLNSFALHVLWFVYYRMGR